MTDPKHSRPDAAEPVDSGIFDLAELVRRYESDPPPPDDLAVSSWTPQPMLGPGIRAPSGWSSSKRWAWLTPLVAAAIFALGHVSGAFAAARLGFEPEPEAMTLDAKAHPTPAPGGRAEVEAEPAPVAEPEPEPVVQPQPEPTAATTPRRRARRPARTPAPPAPAAPVHQWETGSHEEAAIDRDLDTLLDSALGGPAEATPGEAPTEALPPTPTARQVRTTLDALAGEVRQCAESGDVTARIVISGPTGRVSSASVSGSARAACMERVLRTARFPRFERERFTVLYPYRW